MDELAQAIKAAEREGLKPADYHLETIRKRAAARSSSSAANPPADAPIATTTGVG